MENSNQGQDGGYILRLDVTVTGLAVVTWGSKPGERRPLKERVFAQVCCQQGALQWKGVHQGSPCLLEEAVPCAASTTLGLGGKRPGCGERARP